MKIFKLFVRTPIVMNEKYKILANSKGIDMKKLTGKTISLVGLDSVGSMLASSLVRNGFNVRLIDRGRVEVEELASQSLFLEEDVNKFKAKQGKKRLELVNTDVKVKAFHEELTEETDYLLDSDIVVDCTNNKDATAVISNYCLENELPVIYVNNIEDGCDIVVQKEGGKKVNVESFEGPKELLVSYAHRATGLVLEIIFNLLNDDKKVKSTYGVRRLS